MKTKQQRLINAIWVASALPLMFSLTTIISYVSGYHGFTVLQFLVSMFLGTSIFFVGSYLEAKYEDTHGIDWYISNRKTKMRSAVLGCGLSMFMAVLSLFVA